MHPYSLRIGHLYAHFLNIYGDRGNIITLEQRCKWRDITVEVKSIGIGDVFDPDYYDLYFIGGGQDRQQLIIAEDLFKRKSDIHKAYESGAVIFAVCGGYQLLGHYYKPHEGAELKGISLLDAFTVAGHRRMIGNIVVRREDGSDVVGFENHSGKTYLGKNLKPLGRAVVGNGNNGEDGCEGAEQNTVYGTYLHGSILPKNPLFADRLISQALRRRNGDVKLVALDDQLELSAHARAKLLPA